jgi:hypothetical protein
MFAAPPPQKCLETWIKVRFIPFRRSTAEQTDKTAALSSTWTISFQRDTQRFFQRQLLECSGVLRCQRAVLLYERGLSLFRFSFEGCFDDLFADESPRRTLTEQPSAGDPHAVDVSASWANEWRHGNQETHPTNRSNGNSLDGDWTRPLPAFSVNGVSEI